MVPAWRKGKPWLGWAVVLACVPLAAVPVTDAWRTIRLTEADPVAPPAPPGDFRSQRLAGALALQARHLPSGDAFLRRALALSPMDAESWRLFAATKRAEGQQAAAAVALRQAATLTWRDPPTQRRLMLAAFRTDALAAGVTHADALLRQVPNDQLGMAALLTAMDYDEGQAALARHLAASPAWRKFFFTGLLIGGDEDAQGLVALMRRMRATAAPPTPEESGIALSKLIQAGFGPLALAYWREASGRPAGYDFANDDPDFANSLPGLQAATAGPPFGWALANGAGVQIGNGRDAAGRPALTFDGPPDGTGQIVTRPVLLSPGPYQLSFAETADGQPTSRFRPRLTCATDGRTLPFDTLRPHVAAGALVSRIAVTVPADCTALFLGFGLAPGDDGQMHGFALRQVHWSRGHG